MGEATDKGPGSGQIEDEVAGEEAAPGGEAAGAGP